ncbi:MAG: ATP-binding protein, partial [Bacteroidota bacterium]|nr:ATP-binding protein [Bacteroidota bacterium]
HRHAETDVTVSLDIEVGLSLTVDHADCFSGALEPVLDNAIRFTGNGQVRIKARISDQDLVIRILDQGPGLPEGSVSLFAPFQQGSTGLNRAHQGLGLSLFNAKSAISRLDGSIKLRGLKEQVGTLVTLTIPAGLVSSTRVLREEPTAALAPVDLKAVKHVDSDAEHTPVRRAA